MTAAGLIVRMWMAGKPVADGGGVSRRVSQATGKAEPTVLAQEAGGDWVVGLLIVGGLLVLLVGAQVWRCAVLRRLMVGRSPDPRAMDLVSGVPSIGQEGSMYDAARLLAAEQSPGLVVVDAADRAVGIVSAEWVLQQAMPGRYRDDPPAGGALDLRGVARRELAGCSVGHFLWQERRELAAVEADASVWEVAATMARAHTPLVAVIDSRGVLLGAITLNRLLDQLVSR